MNKKLIVILLRRFLSSILLLFLLISFIFILLRIAPGDPVQKFISPDLSPELADKIRESFQLNGSIFEQYFLFLENIVKGDFGISYNYRLPVLTVIWDYLPFTLIFASISFIFELLISYFLALKVAKNFGSRFDKFVSKISFMIYSVPSFVLAVILIFIFSVTLNLFPSSDLTSIYFDDLNFWEKGLDYISHMILPVLTLSLGGVVVFYKYLRDNIESVYGKSFVMKLRADGMNEKEILKKHVIPNAIGPVISVAGVELGFLLSGALITEVIFGLPGMGRLTVNAIMLRDFPLVVGCAFISGVLMIFSNLIADLIKVKIDKRLLKGMLN